MIDVVVDIQLWFEVFRMETPSLGDIVRIGTFCRDLSIPITVPDNCETEMPFLVMNVTSEGFKGYAYLQHTSMWDYSRVPGTHKILLFPACSTLNWQPPLPLD